MQEIGNLLKKERQEKGISLEEISRKTKIQVRYLQALEDGDFSRFAGKVYIKGALRNYAESVGINATELISYYERTTEGKKRGRKSGEQKWAVRGKRKAAPSCCCSDLGHIAGCCFWREYLVSFPRKF